MTKFVLMSSVSLLLLFTPIQSWGQEALTSKEKAELQKMYVDYLTDEGYRPEIDADGDVTFKSEGKSYFINVVEDDPTYFRVVLPNIWPIESEAERTQVFIAVDHSNAKAKVTKTYVVKDNVWVGIEVFLPKADDFKEIFKRSMGALNNGVAHFVSKMREQQGEE